MAAVRHSFHTFFARGPSSFLNGEPDWNGMQRSCSNDSVTPACIWRVNASPRYSRSSTHWDGKNSLPIAFRRAGGWGDVMCLVCVCVCVCMWGGVFASVQDWLIHVLGSEACEVMLSHHRSDPVEVELTSHHKCFALPPQTHSGNHDHVQPPSRSFVFCNWSHFMNCILINPVKRLVTIKIFIGSL